MADWDGTVPWDNPDSEWSVTVANDQWHIMSKASASLHLLDRTCTCAPLVTVTDHAADDAVDHHG